MKSGALLIISDEEARKKAALWISKAQIGSRIQFKGPRRTLSQNDRMWAMLTDIVTQHLFNGRRYTTDEAKIVFLHACGNEIAILPSLDGKSFVPYGRSSSDLSVSEMSDLTEFMFAWGAENNIVWSDPNLRSLLEAAE